MIPHIKTNDNHWTVIVDSQPVHFDAQHPEYHGLVDCVMSGDLSEFDKLINVGTVIDDWSDGNFHFKNGYLYFGDEQIAHQPTERIISLIKNGYDYEAMLNYLTNLYDNVSKRAVDESYNWCSHKGLPITPDGYLMGYKGVARHNGELFVDKAGNEVKAGDLVDKYTRKTFRNNIGDSPRMPRRQVCDDHTIGCEAGLHVGTYDYACSWAGNEGCVVLVKFNPANIVSVPSDCSHQKIRVSEYTVIDIAREELTDLVYDDDDDFDDDHYYEEYEDLDF